MKWWGCIVIATLIFWFSSLFYRFAQDDFIHLNVSSANSLGEFLNFFNPFHQFPDIFFFRPLPTQVHFFLMTKLFGLNALPFHIVSLTFHILNGLLFYLIINKIWKNNKLALLSSIFYLLSSIHFLSLFYISSFQQIARTFYLFLAIFLYLKAKSHSGEHSDSRILPTSLRVQRSNLFYLGSILAYIAALLSKETSLVLPLLLPLLEILRRRGESIGKVLKENILPLIPFIGITISYIIIRAIGLQTLFTKGEYAYSFSILNIFQNLKWYLIWTLGLPEILSTYPSLKPNSLIQFAQDFSQGGQILILSLIFIVRLFLILLLHKLMYVRTIAQWKVLIISGLVFLVSLAPVLVLTQHKYPQYLDLAFLGILPIIGWVFIKGFDPSRHLFEPEHEAQPQSRRPERSSEGSHKIVAIVSLISFAALQYFSINLSEQTHWTTKRSKLADYYHQTFLKEYPNPEKDTKIILVGSPASTREVAHALAGRYAFLIWYPGKISNVQYLEEKDLPKTRSNLIIKYIDKY